MSAKETLFKLKPLIIVILLFSVVFFIRMDAMYINNVPHDYKSLFEDQNGLPYFSEMDSYYNYRMTQDYLDHGYLGDTIQNGIQWDLHSYYPLGRSAEYPPLIAVVTAFAYKIVNAFANVPLNAVAIWLAPFVASLAVIPAYLFVRRLTDDYGGITAGLLVGLAPAYFAHTYAGFFDTDMFNMIFPILVVGFFVVSILARDIRTRSIYVSLSAISLLVYAAAWEGWWYMFYLVIGTAVVYLLVSNYLFKMKTIKPFKEYSSKLKWFLDQPALFSLVIFAVASFLLIGIIMGFSEFTGIVSGISQATQLQSTVQGTSYPNVFLTVGEMRASTLGDVIDGIGGYLPFIFGILAIPLLLWKLKPDTDNRTKEVKAPKRKSKPRRKAKKKKTKVAVEKIEKNNLIDPQVMENKKNYLLYAVLFSLWLLGIGYLVTKGVRFIENFAVPISLCAGIFMGLIVPYFKEHIKNARFSALAVLFVIALVAYSPVSAAYTTSNSVIPGTDDSMYNAMTWIKNNTPENTVLTSWWDFGHLFTAVADRPVTFDGGSQNTPRAYWVAKALVTSNENLSAGILRMLTSSGDKGIETLENYTHNTGKSVEILNKILPVDKQAAQTILVNDYNLTPEQAQNLLQYTHPDNPAPHELILSSDMLSATKSTAWSSFGNWNFQNNTGQSYGYSAAQAVPQKVNNTTVLKAQNGVIIQVNGNNITAGIQYTQYNQTQILEPYKLIVVQNGSVALSQTISNESSFDIVLINENNTEIAVAMSKELENSMFTRLFLMNGTGLSRFKFVHKDGGILDPYGTMVWKVN
jgi:asparagine N-glycosylation enzyme membrane subunit Stt3